MVSLLALGASAGAAAAENAFARITTLGGATIPGDQVDIKGVTGALNAIRVFATEVGLATQPTPGSFIQPGAPQAVPLVLT